MRTSNNGQIRGILPPVVLAVLAASIALPILVRSATGAMRPEGPTSGQSPVMVRDVGADEIKASRGATEDRLRSRLLSLFDDEEVLATLRDILNRPWDAEGVRFLWSMAAEHGTPEHAHARFTIHQKGAALDLLAYVNKTYGNNASSEKTTQLVRTAFDSLFESILSNDDKRLEFHYLQLHAFALRSIADYGSANLLTPAFWECFAAYQEGPIGLRAVRKVGDSQALERLERLEKTLRVWRDREQFLQETMGDLRARLSKAEQAAAAAPPVR